MFWAYVDENMNLVVHMAYSKEGVERVSELAKKEQLNVFHPFYAKNLEDARSKIYPEFMAFVKSYQEM